MPTKRSMAKIAARSRRPMDPIQEEEQSSQCSDHSGSRKIYASREDAELSMALNAMSREGLFESVKDLDSPTDLEIVQRYSANWPHVEGDSSATSKRKAVRIPELEIKARKPTFPLWKHDPSKIVVRGTTQAAPMPELSLNFGGIEESIERSCTEVSPPYEYMEKTFLNWFDSEVNYLNSYDDEVCFFTTSKRDFHLYSLSANLGRTVPILRQRRKFPQLPGKLEYWCKCVAVDSTLNNRIAFGMDSGDICITSAYQDQYLNFKNSQHILMTNKAIALSHLAWDKSQCGNSSLCACYGRGRGKQCQLSLYDVNRSIAVSDREVTERIYDMQFLSVDLSTLLLSCLRNFRFIDLRARIQEGMQTTNIDIPMMKIALEPYNNVQFAGCYGNTVVIYDRRYLADCIYERTVGPESFTINHLEYNPNHYGNISCSSTSAGTVYELNVSPDDGYVNHAETSKIGWTGHYAIDYMKDYSYNIKRIDTSLEQVQHFRWCHQIPNLMIAIPPRAHVIPPNQNVDPDVEAQFQTIFVEHHFRSACIPADGSVIYAFGKKVTQMKGKPALTSVLDRPNTKAVSKKSSREEANTNIEAIRAAKKTKRRSPRSKLLKPVSLSAHNRLPLRDVQRHRPFRNGLKVCPPIKDLQFWFHRNDVDILLLSRTSRGYGFAKTASSAKELIECSYNAIKELKDDNDGLKQCWRLLFRYYVKEQSPEFMRKYGTPFPGVRRIARSARSTLIVRDDALTFRNRYYVSHGRDEILRICGWVAIDDHKGLALKLERLVASSDINDKIRAATMAMFFMQGNVCKTYMLRIIDYLKSNECKNRNKQSVVNENLEMVEIVYKALVTNDGINFKGYDEMIVKLSHPYLAAMLMFIARRQHALQGMQREIMSTDMSLRDRITFATIHMDDEPYRFELKRLTDSIHAGSDPLSVLLISGLDDHKYAHQAIHAYVERTSDIQTAALLLCAGNCFRMSKIWEEYDMRKSVMERITLAVSNNALINTRKYSLQIVLCYMDWLQTSRLVLQKSFIMTFLRKRSTLPFSDPRVVARQAQGIVVCNFCGEPIVPYLNKRVADFIADPTTSPAVTKIDYGRMITMAAAMQVVRLRQGTHAPKLHGCPHCGKALPRCVICKANCEQHYSVYGEPLNVDDWFVWCTHCAHGGHLKHLRQWFGAEKHCPAGGCECECPKHDDVFNANIVLAPKAPNTAIQLNDEHVDLLAANAEAVLRTLSIATDPATPVAAPPATTPAAATAEAASIPARPHSASLSGTSAFNVDRNRSRKSSLRRRTTSNLSERSVSESAAIDIVDGSAGPTVPMDVADNAQTYPPNDSRRVNFSTVAQVDQLEESKEGKPVQRTSPQPATKEKSPRRKSRDPPSPPPPRLPVLPPSLVDPLLTQRAQSSTSTSIPPPLTAESRRQSDTFLIQQSESATNGTPVVTAASADADDWMRKHLRKPTYTKTVNYMDEQFDDVQFLKFGRMIRRPTESDEADGPKSMTKNLSVNVDYGRDIDPTLSQSTAERPRSSTRSLTAARRNTVGSMMDGAVEARDDADSANAYATAVDSWLDNCRVLHAAPINGSAESPFFGAALSTNSLIPQSWLPNRPPITDQPSTPSEEESDTDSENEEELEKIKAMCETAVFYARTELEKEEADNRIHLEEWNQFLAFFEAAIIPRLAEADYAGTDHFIDSVPESFVQQIYLKYRQAKRNRDDLQRAESASTATPPGSQHGTDAATSAAINIPPSRSLLSRRRTSTSDTYEEGSPRASDAGSSVASREDADTVATTSSHNSDDQRPGPSSAFAGGGTTVSRQSIQIRMGLNKESIEAQQRVRDKLIRLQELLYQKK